MEQKPQKQRSNNSLLLLTVFLVIGSAVGTAVYQFLQEEKASDLPDASGFDFSATQDSKDFIPQTAAPAVQPTHPASRFGFLKTPGQQLFGSKKTPPAKPAAAGFAEAVWDNEKRIRKLAIAYTRRYPVISAYGREWMSYPDLKKLNDDYMRDRNPVKFMRGVAKSRNFYNLVKKYAPAAPIQGFVQEAMAQTPPQDLSSAMMFLEKDPTIKTMVNDVTSSLGVPASMLANPGRKSAVNEKEVMGRIMEQTEGPRF